MVILVTWVLWIQGTANRRQIAFVNEIRIHNRHRLAVLTQRQGYRCFRAVTVTIDNRVFEAVSACFTRCWSVGEGTIIVVDYRTFTRIIRNINSICLSSVGPIHTICAFSVVHIHGDRGCCVLNQRTHSVINRRRHIIDDLHAQCCRGVIAVRIRQNDPKIFKEAVLSICIGVSFVVIKGIGVGDFTSR